jgi:hypothetical protein
MAKIHRRERFADFAHTLARVEWQFFTTQIFKNPLPKPYVRGSMFWRWCRDVSEISKTPYKNLLIALRGEQGEIGARPHFHCLVGGVGPLNGSERHTLSDARLKAKKYFREYEPALKTRATVADPLEFLAEKPDKDGPE